MDTEESEKVKENKLHRVKLFDTRTCEGRRPGCDLINLSGTESWLKTVVLAYKTFGYPLQSHVRRSLKL